MGREVFTTITPIPHGVSRETVMETLQDHLEMIDLNPTHFSRSPIKPPPEASPEEYHCKWYQITDKISYLPGIKGDVHFKACFHDLPLGLQTHVLAPMGLEIKEKWTLGGNMPHEPVQPVEIGLGAPISGLYLREDVEIKANFLVVRFVKKQLKDALATLVARLVVKSQLVEAVHQNQRLTYASSSSAGQFTPPLGSPMSLPPMSPRQNYSPPMSPPPTGGMGMPMDYPPTWAEAHAQQLQQAGHRASYVPPQYSPGQQPQYSPQFPTQQYHQQQSTMQQQQQQQQLAHQQSQAQKKRDSNLSNHPALNEMDGTHQHSYPGPQPGYYGPAELPS